MCPNCIRGLVNGEVCKQCAGTGFWNPESLSVNEVQTMQDEQATAPTGVPESTSGGVETAAVETADTSSTPTDQGVQAPADVAPAEDQVNG